MKKILICAFTISAIIFASCSNDETTQPQESSEELTPEGVAHGVAEGVSAMRIDFTQSITYNYSTATQKDSIIETIIVDIFDVDLHSYNDSEGKFISDEFAVNIIVNESSKTITVQPEPIYQIIVTNSDEDDDNKKCGGKEGDGWKSYGTCMSEPCVSDKSKAAAEELSDSLVQGKCLDIRVKRNTLNARVCARVISC